MKKESEVLFTIKKNSLKYIEDIMKNPDRQKLLLVVLQGKIEGTRERERRKKILDKRSGSFDLTQLK